MSMPNNSSSGDTPALASHDAKTAMALEWLSPRRAFVLLIVYFVLQTFLRVLVSDSAELDESEQLLWTQTWAWGYGSDPPLYTWLQILTFQVIGLNVLGLALLKNLLLVSIFGFTFLAAKAASGSAKIASLAMLSLFFFPQITWESQRDLTHSVLATTAAAATFYSMTRIMKAPRLSLFLALGVCLALGILSKYSFVLFVAALGLALLTLPEFRRTIVNRKMAWAALAFLLLTSLHFLWMFHQPKAAFRRPDEILEARDGWRVIAWAKGGFSLIKCLFMLGGAITVVYCCLFPKRDNVNLTPAANPYLRLIGRTLVFVLFLCGVVILVFAVELRDRWFQPIVFLGAILAALLARERLTSRNVRRFFFVTASLVAVVLVVLSGIPLMAARTNRPTRLNAPYSVLSQHLKAQVGEPPVIIAETRLVGGNLRLWFGQSRVIAPEFDALPVSTNADWLVVWDASKKENPAAPLASLVARRRGIDLSRIVPSYVEAPFKFVSGKRMRLGFVLLRPG